MREGGREHVRHATVPQPALLPDGAADAPDARGRRARRHSDRAGHLLAGLAAPRHRLELARRGEERRPVRAMGDIGTHWCDMLEHVTGERIGSVCADLGDVPRRAEAPGRRHRGLRRRAVPPGFAGAWAFTVSQVSAGCKNQLSLEIYGTRASVKWNQERPDELLDWPSSWPERSVDEGPRAARFRRGALCGAAWRPRRRLRRYVQAAVPPFLPVDRGPGPPARVSAVHRRPAADAAARRGPREPPAPGLGRCGGLEG